MAQDRPTNFFEVLFKSAGAGLSEVGEKLPGAKQQERQNKIQTLMLGMQMQQSQRDQQLNSLNMQMRKLQITGLEAQTKKILRDSAKTPEQLAAEEARAQTAGTLEAIRGFEGMTAPEGFGFDIPGLSPIGEPKIPKLDVNQFMLDQLGPEAFADWQTGTGAFTPPPKEPTSAELRARGKETERKSRRSVLTKANNLYQKVVSDTERSKAGVVAINDEADLQKVVAHLIKTGGRTRIRGNRFTDEFFPDESDPKITGDLNALLDEYISIGATETVLTADEEAEFNALMEKQKQ